MFGTPQRRGYLKRTGKPVAQGIRTPFIVVTIETVAGIETMGHAMTPANRCEDAEVPGL